jgi:rhamnosyltransferase
VPNEAHKVACRPVTVVVPTKNGRRYLREVLEAVRSQRVDFPVQLLVIDSGSVDGSPDIARESGADVIEITPREFGH